MRNVKSRGAVSEEQNVERSLRPLHIPETFCCLRSVRAVVKETDASFVIKYFDLVDEFIRVR